MRPSDLLSRDPSLTRNHLDRPTIAMRPSAQRLAASSAMLIGAAIVAASGLIHLYLWADGYKHITTIGPLFFAQAIAGLVLAVLLVAYPRMLAAAAGVAYLIATIGAFALSATVGLFGFMDTLDAPWSTTSLVVESAGIALLAIGGALSAIESQNA
jgi:hypothetical protein